MKRHLLRSSYARHNISVKRREELASVKRAPLIREPPPERNLIIGEVHFLPGRAPTFVPPENLEMSERMGVIFLS
jgi:hypothetical protein